MSANLPTAAIRVPQGAKLLDTEIGAWRTLQAAQHFSEAVQGRSGMWYVMFLKRQYAVRDQDVEVINEPRRIRP